MTLREKFDRGYVPEPTSGCWLWDRSLRKDGYAQVEARRGKAVLAHRLSWQLNRGPIPNGLYICHKCDVKSCVNPDHLFVGTCADNIRDRVVKGLHHAIFGSRHPKAKLSDAAVVHIKQKAISGVAYARMYGVSPTAISLIQRGRNRVRV